MSSPIDYVKHQVSEHFDNYVVVVINRDGELEYRYSNWMVADMLLTRAGDNIREDMDLDFVWEEEEEGEEED